MNNLFLEKEKINPTKKKSSLKEKNKIGKKYMYLAAAMIVSAMVIPLNILATSVTSSATSGLTSLATFFSTAVRIIGFIFGVYSMTILGPGLSQHDNSQIKMGLLSLTGALIVVFHMEILGLMGITI